MRRLGQVSDSFSDLRIRVEVLSPYGAETQRVREQTSFLHIPLPVVKAVAPWAPAAWWQFLVWRLVLAIAAVEQIDGHCSCTGRIWIEFDEVRLIISVRTVGRYGHNTLRGVGTMDTTSLFIQQRRGEENDNEAAANGDFQDLECTIAHSDTLLSSFESLCIVHYKQKNSK